VVSTAKRLFKHVACYLDLIDEIIPIASSHEYHFVSDEWYQQWAKSDQFTIERANFIIALELIDKAHLVAVVALLRARRWSDAMCSMFERENLSGWAASARGLLESAGDTREGLSAIPEPLARHYHTITECLSGTKNEFVHVGELEKTLDHFVHAGWTRLKDSVLKAKANESYVGIYWTQLLPTL
jgi:hypothetical protein